MVIKDMKRSSWKRVVEKEYLSKKFKYDKYYGVISLTKINKVTSPLIINNEVLADVDYKWLQIALHNQNVWITAMFDDSNRLVQVYFDITHKNFFDDKTNPSFVDMYLDIIITSNNEVKILDEDELEEAFIKKEITEGQYNDAKQTCCSLYNYLKINKENVVNFIKEEYRRFLI